LNVLDANKGAEEPCHNSLDQHFNQVVQAIRRNSGIKSKARHYTDFDIQMGIAVLGFGKKCHNFVRAKLYPIPSVPTLKRLMNSVMTKVSLFL
jgi:hypothetical protein